VNRLRDWICHRMGWETYDEAHARIAAEIERDYPRPNFKELDRRRAREREAKARRLDHDGEYQRGMEGFQ
jgi:hypothetical protein